MAGHATAQCPAWRGLALPEHRQRGELCAPLHVCTSLHEQLQGTGEQAAQGVSNLRTLNLHAQALRVWRAAVHQLLAQGAGAAGGRARL